MTDALFREIGGTQLDGTSEIASGGTLYTIDPSQQQLLAWVKAVVTHELNAKGWANAVTGTTLAGKAPVQMAVNRQPEKQLLQQVGIDYPTLFLWPKQSVTEEFTLEKDKLTTTWGLLYLLGPLNEADHARVGAMLRLFDKTFTALLRARGHGAHESGAVQFDDGQVEFSSIRKTRAGYGASAELGTNTDGLPFYAAELELETEEIDQFIDGADPDFDGTSTTLEHLSPEGSFEVGQIRTP